MPSDLVKQLEALYANMMTGLECNGTPNASVVYEAARHIEALKAELSGVRAGTYAIVPVEPTEAMVEMAFDVVESRLPLKRTEMFQNIYRAMIKAAQEGEDANI